MTACWSCERTPGRDIPPAVYLWIAQPSGNQLPLCERCCAIWRENAVKEPDLLPSRITLIEALTPR